MKHTITVGRGFGKKRFDQALEMAESGDTILIEEGTYDFENGYKLSKNLIIKGIADNPEKVVLNTSFYLYAGIHFELDNLLLHPSIKRNGINVEEGSTLSSSNAIFNAENVESESKYPLIYVGDESKAELISCNVYSNNNQNVNKVLEGIYATKGANITLTSCIADVISLEGSKLNISNSQITICIFLDNSSVTESADYVQFLGTNENKYSIYEDNSSIVKLNQFEKADNDIYAYLSDSLLKINEIESSGTGEFVIRYNDQSTADVDENKATLENLDEEKRQEKAREKEEAEKEKKAQAANNKVSESNENSESKNETQQNFQEKNNEESEDRVEPQEDDALEQLDNLYGLKTVKEQVKRFINHAKFEKLREDNGLVTTPVTLHSLFLGNPGTGKTTVARLLGKILYQNGVVSTDKFVEASRKDLVADIIGGTAKNTQAILDKANGGILFIDEAYSLYSESKQDFGNEAISTILKYMEDHRNEIMIIFAGYTEQMQDFINMNPGLASRIPNVFDFEDYTPEEIAEIGYKDLINTQHNVYQKKYMDIVINQYSHSIDHSNARWVRNFNNKLLSIAGERIVEEKSDDLRTITQKDLDKLVGGNKEEKQENVKKLLAELNNLTGLENVKTEVSDLIKEAQIDKKLAEKGLSKPSYHMVFEGNPGTGKTTVAEIVAKLFYNLDILPKPIVKTVERSTLVGKFIGETEANTTKAIKEAMGGVLFVDEAYQLTDDSSDNDFGKKAVETLITALENYRDKFVVIFAGYTENMEHFLDANPGLRSRVQTKIMFPDYSEDEISTMVNKRITKTWTVDSQYLQQIVKKCFESDTIENQHSNGRWARNFAERLDKMQKVYLVDNNVPDDKLGILPNSVLDSICQEYINA
jgi:SpoVK/Ycf46/Vps4 family AAA+-type ATPase